MCTALCTLLQGVEGRVRSSTGEVTTRCLTLLPPWKQKEALGMCRWLWGTRAPCSPFLHLPLWWRYLRFTPPWLTARLLFHKPLPNTRICLSTLPTYSTLGFSSPKISGWGPRHCSLVSAACLENTRVKKQSTSAHIFDTTMRSDDTTRPVNANMKYGVFKLNEQIKT